MNNFIALSLALISFACVSIYLPESPRFLYSRKEFVKCKEVIRKIAEVNQKTAEIGQYIRFEAEAQDANEEDGETESSYRNDDGNVVELANNASTLESTTESNLENIPPLPARRTVSLGASLRNLEPHLSVQEIK